MEEDGSESMPEGAFSRTAAFPDDRGFLTASLSIPKIDDRHAGVYCCAPEPPVEHFYGQTPRCAEFRLIVNGKQNFASSVTYFVLILIKST